jgi:hypothetical protein
VSKETYYRVSKETYYKVSKETYYRVSKETYYRVSKETYYRGIETSLGPANGQRTFDRRIMVTDHGQ